MGLHIIVKDYCLFDNQFLIYPDFILLSLIFFPYAILFVSQQMFLTWNWFLHNFFQPDFFYQDSINTFNNSDHLFQVYSLIFTHFLDDIISLTITFTLHCSIRQRPIHYLLIMLSHWFTNGFHALLVYCKKNNDFLQIYNTTSFHSQRWLNFLVLSSNT